MKPYEQYKNSGIDWLGQVPSHWEIGRVKNLFRLVAEPAEDNHDFQLLSVYSEIGVRPRAELEERGNRASTTDGYWIVKKGDIVVNKLLAWMGGIGLSEYDGVTSPAYDILRPYKPINGLYFHLLFRTPLMLSEFKRHSRGIMDMRLRLYFEELGSIKIPIPPLPEQTAIAKFLDEKTTQIQMAIGIKNEQIAKLKEYRQALINQKVTKGLKADVAMRRVGVSPPLNEIPVHWEVKKFRFLFSFRKGLAITKENLQETGIPCVNYGEIHSKYGFSVNPKIDELKCVSEDYLKNNPKSLLNYGDFVFADTSEDIEGSGNFTYLNSDELTFAGYHTIICSLKEQHYPRFLAYIFDSLSFRNQIRQRVKGVKVFSITQNILKDNLVWLPPLPEQLAIAEFLDKKTAQIDKAIAHQQNQIERLKEYQQSLVNDVVTGKMRVSNLENNIGVN